MNRASDVPPLVDSCGCRPVTSVMAAVARSVNGPGLVTKTSALDECLKRSLAVVVVVADVETRPRFAGNEINRRVADVDRSEFKMGRRKMLAALVERRLQRGDQSHEPADRIVGTLGIGDMTLPAGDNHRAVERTA